MTINRAPVLTMWAAVVAERLGFDRDEALTLGRAVAGLNAFSKGTALGLFKPRPKDVEDRRRRLRRGEPLTVDLLHRAVPAVRTADGLRALSKDRPVTPDGVKRYLESKFGDALPDAWQAMTELARALPPEQLQDRAYRLYEDFRPGVPAGAKGWGAAGELDLARIDRLARRAGQSAARPEALK